jgi:hypothetical protein
MTVLFIGIVIMSKKIAQKVFDGDLSRGKTVNDNHSIELKSVNNDRKNSRFLTCMHEDEKR